jgi:hypothetical protein
MWMSVSPCRAAAAPRCSCTWPAPCAGRAFHSVSVDHDLDVQPGRSVLAGKHALVSSTVFESVSRGRALPKCPCSEWWCWLTSGQGILSVAVDRELKPFHLSEWFNPDLTKCTLVPFET